MVNYIRSWGTAGNAKSEYPFLRNEKWTKRLLTHSTTILAMSNYYGKYFHFEKLCKIAENQKKAINLYLMEYFWNIYCSVTLSILLLPYSSVTYESEFWLWYRI